MQRTFDLIFSPPGAVLKKVAIDPFLDAPIPGGCAGGLWYPCVRVSGGNVLLGLAADVAEPRAYIYIYRRSFVAEAQDM